MKMKEAFSLKILIYLIDMILNLEPTGAKTIFFSEGEGLLSLIM
jgi:hypothetical protein